MTAGVREPEAAVIIRPIEPVDAGEVLTLQRAAFASDAILYDDPRLDVMTQTLEQVEAELADNRGMVAFEGPRMVGAVRAMYSGGVLLVGRLAVAPDRQGDGIGTRLLAAVERAAVKQGCEAAELFTGSGNTANIELYRRLGYEPDREVDQGDGTAQVFMRKSLVSTSACDAT